MVWKLSDDWESGAVVLWETAKKVFDVSSEQGKENKEIWRYNEELQESI